MTLVGLLFLFNNLLESSCFFFFYLIYCQKTDRCIVLPGALSFSVAVEGHVAVTVAFFSTSCDKAPSDGSSCEANSLVSPSGQASDGCVTWWCALSNHGRKRLNHDGSSEWIMRLCFDGEFAFELPFNICPLWCMHTCVYVYTSTRMCVHVDVSDWHQKSSTVSPPPFTLVF